ncbi:DNA repair protein RecO [Candidatus Acetothermia bacterium]|nr:DNA repair protein RecO [Candidatus Acetothermia bacterium]
MIHKTVGLILRAIDYRESDSILTVLTRDYGKVSLIAKGARRTDSKFTAALDLLTFSELVFYEGENLKLLKEASIVENLREVKREYERLEVAIEAIRLAHVLIEDDHPDLNVFELLRDGLAQLGHVSQHAIWALAYKLKLLRALGFAPRLGQCASCGRNLTPELWFSPANGGLVCQECHRAGDTRVEAKLAQELRMILGISWEKLDRLVLPAQDITLAHRLLDELVGYHLRSVQ